MKHIFKLIIFTNLVFLAAKAAELKREAEKTTATPSQESTQENESKKIAEYVALYNHAKEALLRKDLGSARKKFTQLDETFSNLSSQEKSKLPAHILYDIITYRVGLKPTNGFFFDLISKLISAIKDGIEKPFVEWVKNQQLPADVPFYAHIIEPSVLANTSARGSSELKGRESFSDFSEDLPRAMSSHPKKTAPTKTDTEFEKGLLAFIEEANKKNINPINYAIERQNIEYALHLIKTRPWFITQNKKKDPYPLLSALYNNDLKTDVRDNIISTMIKTEPLIINLAQPEELKKFEKKPLIFNLNEKKLHQSFKLALRHGASPNESYEGNRFYHLQTPATPRNISLLEDVIYQQRRWANGIPDEPYDFHFLQALIEAGVDFKKLGISLIHMKSLINQEKHSCSQPNSFFTQSLDDSFENALTFILNSPQVKNNDMLREFLVNAPDPESRLQPLCEAAENDWTKEAKLLLAHGANCTDSRYRGKVTRYIQEFEAKHAIERKQHLADETGLPTAVLGIVESYVTSNFTKKEIDFLQDYDQLKTIFLDHTSTYGPSIPFDSKSKFYFTLNLKDLEESFQKLTPKEQANIAEAIIPDEFNTRINAKLPDLKFFTEARALIEQEKK